MVSVVWEVQLPKKAEGHQEDCRAEGEAHRVLERKSTTSPFSSREYNDVRMVVGIDCCV